MSVGNNTQGFDPELFGPKPFTPCKPSKASNIRALIIRIYIYIFIYLFILGGRGGIVLSLQRNPQMVVVISQAPILYQLDHSIPSSLNPKP